MDQTTEWRKKSAPSSVRVLEEEYSRCKEQGKGKSQVREISSLPLHTEGFTLLHTPATPQPAPPKAVVRGKETDEQERDRDDHCPSHSVLTDLDHAKHDDLNQGEEVEQGPEVGYSLWRQHERPHRRAYHHDDRHGGPHMDHLVVEPAIEHAQSRRDG